MANASPLLTPAPQTPVERRQQMTQDIKRLKKEQNAVILAHLYERIEVQDIADFHGDSLGLSQLAMNTDADIIIFCGVHFMAETAKLLNPTKKVYLANPNAGCPMADMITRDELVQFKAEHPGIPVVAYVNTSADVKSVAEYCCTSANAVEVVAHAAKEFGVSEVLFVPDRHLGGYVQTQLPHITVTCWDGFCPTHLRMNPEDVVKLKKENPDAEILVHPECDTPMKDMADFIGSTTAIVQYAKESRARTFIVCTEDGVSQRLSQDCPEKTFYTPTRASAVCPNMKLTRIENVYKTLMGQNQEITIPADIVGPARQCIDSMMKISGSKGGPAMTGKESV